MSDDLMTTPMDPRRPGGRAEPYPTTARRLGGPPPLTARPIPAVTLTQPWASLMACGAKTMETRTWFPWKLEPGMRVAIHASGIWGLDEQILCTTEPFKTALRAAHRAGYLHDGEGYVTDVRRLPVGKVLAVATYRGAILSQSEQMRPALRATPHPEWERAFGNFARGRWVWRFDEITPIVPVRVAGARYIWTWTPAVAPTALELIAQPLRARPPAVTAPPAVAAAVSREYLRQIGLWADHGRAAPDDADDGDDAGAGRTSEAAS